MPWQRDELLLCLSLYHRLRFGQFNARNPAVIQLAELLGRTAGSVGMKLSNFASFDPALAARGIRGLVGASSLDRIIWDEFRGNIPAHVHATKRQIRVLLGTRNDQVVDIRADGTWANAPATAHHEEPSVESSPAADLQDSYFRIAVLNNYDGRCAVTGLNVPELLIATRILPRSSHPDLSLNISNGISFSGLYHTAFLRGLIGLNDDLRVLVAPRLRHAIDASSFDTFFGAYDGRSILLPPDAVQPDLATLRHHRELHQLSS